MALPRLFRRWSKFLRARIRRRRRPIRFFRLRFDPLEVRVVPNTYTVTTTADAGAGSLRQAILDANANAGADTIDFGIGTGAQTIAPLSALPTVTDPVTIDATTQPGFGGVPLIELRGDSAGSGVDGFTITSSGSTIRGFIINRFSSNGVVIAGSGADGNVLSGNYIGTNAAGTAASGNLNAGVFVINGASGNTVGGSVAGAGNVISGNAWAGIWIAGMGTDGNVVAGNFVGTNQAGTAAVPNNNDGILVYSGATNTRIGTDGDGDGDTFERNVISGNAIQGVTVGGSTTNHTVMAGNLIGPSAPGDAAIATGAPGVTVRFGAQNTRIGTDNGDAVERNVISGNTNSGVYIQTPEYEGTLPDGGVQTTGTLVAGNYIGTDATGTSKIGNEFDGVTIVSGATGNTVQGNVIAANKNNDVGVFNADANTIAGNIIGTDKTGTVVLNGPTNAGVWIGGGAQNNVIGGTTAGARNVINGHTNSGIQITGQVFGGGQRPTTGNQVQGNYIGLAPDGSTAVGNSTTGIRIELGATGNTVGGTAGGARNVISGNAGAGVIVNGVGTDSNTVLGNYIGTDAGGTLDRGNTSDGIRIESGASGSVIGGTAAGAGNVISGNNAQGVMINTANNTLIQGNIIGLNASGAGAIANSNGGVWVAIGTGNVVGGTTAGARNIISGNGIAGVSLTSPTGGAIVQGNYIGTNLGGTAAVGNSGPGISVTSNNHLIGGTAAGAENVISGNTGAGISIASAYGNTIQGNRIGLNAAGTAALGNGANGGIRLANGTAGNLIGGADAGAGNTISGNSGDGINISGASTPLGTVSWWKADGNANDSVGTNHGTLQGGATFAPGLAGGQAFSLDGVNDYVTQSLPANVQTPNITLDAWVFLNALGGGSYGQTIVFAEPGGSNSAGRGAGLTISDDGKVKFVKGSGDGLFEVAVGATTVSTGVWHHVAGTFDGSVMRIYLDGAEDGSLANSQPILWAGSGGFPNPGQLYFGAFKTDQLGSGSTVPDVGYLSGRIDEVAVYGRGLTAAEIERIYAAGGPAKGGNTVQGNVIGLNPMGTAVVANITEGVTISNSAGHLIGGTAPGAGNVISGNRSGIQISGAAAL